MTDYPPEPWYLGGELLVSAFLVPRARLPRVLPKPQRALGWGGNVVVGAAFVRYAPGGALSYDELLVAIPSLPGPRVTIPQIWVDSAASMAGGRELWGIPKQLAEFSRTETTHGVTMAMSTVAMSTVASIDARYGRRLVPGMPRLPLTTLQVLDGRRTLAHNHVTGKLSALSAEWNFPSDGPLGYLAHRKPFASFAIRDASIIFGMDVQRS